MNKKKYREQAKVLFNKKRSIALSRKDRLDVNQRLVKSKVNKPIVENKVIILGQPLPRKPKLDAVVSSRVPAKKAGCKGCSRQIKK